jgi:hypothetical protein
LLRVHAEFQRTTGFFATPNTQVVIVARGQITTGYLAITTLRGRLPVAFTSVNDATGKARIFTAPSRCTPTKMPPSR